VSFFGWAQCSPSIHPSVHPIGPTHFLPRSPLSPTIHQPTTYHTPTRQTSSSSSSAAAARIVTQLGQCLDDATNTTNTATSNSNSSDSSSTSRRNPRVLVVGATNRPHDVHPALRRPGRLDKEVGARVFACIRACVRGWMDGWVGALRGWMDWWVGVSILIFGP
jgi:hypothetical protein